MAGTEAMSRELAAGFAAEAGEYVAQLNRDLLELETGGIDEARRTELLVALRRTAHTLKGSAGFTPYRQIVEHAHEIENLLDQLNGREEFNAIYAHLDAVLRTFETDEAPLPEVTETQFTDVVSTEESIRVPTRKLNALMSLIGEILVARVRGEERLNELRELRRRLEETGETALRDAIHGAAQMQRELERDSMHMTILTENLQEEIKRVRMQPIGVLFDGFRRTVRDLAVRVSKQISLVIEGESAEVDKKVLEELREPLLHLLRNAIDHGIESKGTITLRATTSGHSIVIEVADDGRGFDFDAIRRIAASKRLIDDARLAEARESELAELVFAAGFSTRSEVGELSGRGVGLDAVRDKIHRLQGEIGVSSARGAGTRFILTLPLTLSTSRGLLLRAGDGTYALPFTSIQRIIRVPSREFVNIDGYEAVMVDGHGIGVLRLGNVLGVGRDDASESDEKLPVVILQRGSERIALAVDALVAEQEMVVKGLGGHLRHVPYVSGAALLGSGSVVTVLNPSDLFATQNTSHAESKPSPIQTRSKPRILVVEDSLTTRTLEKSILETAGYRVRTARDGVEALQALESDSGDLVITDVDMPRMDGIALLEEIRRREATRELPVILVTSLGSEQHKRAGLERGANAYIVKTEFDQTSFLATIQNVLG